MPNKERHELQARHNQRVLAALPDDVLDWRITLMMYVALHGCRAYISSERPGYAGNDLKYDSLQRILQTDLDNPQVELATDFGRLVKHSYKTRYHCLSTEELTKLVIDATKRYNAILEILRALDVSV